MQGIKKSWLRLPKRKCDNCGEMYKPKQPVMDGKHGFCKRECKNQFHKAGGSYKRLELAIEKGTKGRLSAIEKRLAALEERVTQLEEYR